MMGDVLIVPALDFLVAEHSTVRSAHGSLAGGESAELWGSELLETSSYDTTLLLDVSHGESAT
jgi:hypothetical protein